MSGEVVCRDQAARWSAADALDHPWLRRLRRSRASVEPGVAMATDGDAPRRSGSSDAPSGVVQRIQRFGKFTQFKRSALESIAGQCMRQTREYSQSLDGGGSTAPFSDTGAGPAGSGVQPDDTQKLVVARPAAALAAAAAPPPPRSGGAALSAAATIGAEKVRAKVKGGTSLRRAKGLLEHMMVSDGTVRACRTCRTCRARTLQNVREQL